MPKEKMKTVLIIEDEKPLSDAIRAKLDSAGFVTVTARSVDQALEYLKNSVKIDAVWLDHYLFGERNGVDFVTLLRKKEAIQKDLPIFVVSNTVSPDKIRMYLKLGVKKCYTKVDFRLDEIISDIKRVMKWKKY